MKDFDLFQEKSLALFLHWKLAFQGDKEKWLETDFYFLFFLVARKL